jgi:hypothetical protein
VRTLSKPEPQRLQISSTVGAPRAPRFLSFFNIGAHGAPYVTFSKRCAWRTLPDRKTNTEAKELTQKLKCRLCRAHLVLISFSNTLRMAHPAWLLVLADRSSTGEHRNLPGCALHHHKPDSFVGLG